MPPELQAAIDEAVENVSANALRKARESLTGHYRAGGSSPFHDEASRLAYLGARMPATFAAIYRVLQSVPLPGHFLDLGAGPGTASWAAATLFPALTQFTLIEKSRDAITLGQSLAKHHPHLQHAEWQQRSLEELPQLPDADVAILSYVLNEIKNPEALISHCWKTIPTLILIEPGTPKGFQLIRKLRQQLIDLKAHIIAPCPHTQACPIQGNDWCHFSARVERSRLHRLLKGGTLGYEDEKFSYVIASKNPAPSFSARIIRHPQKNSGHVRLTLCTSEGTIQEKTITRSEKQTYKMARDAEWGDQM